MKRKHIITFILTSFFLITTFHFSHVYAQASISGDGVCGKTAATECTPQDFKKITQGVFLKVLALGSVLMFVFIVYRFTIAWFLKAEGKNPNAIKEAWKAVTEALIGLAIVVAVFGGITYTLLEYLGAQDWTLKLLKAVSVEMVPHAYAATASCNRAGIGAPCTFIAPGRGVRLTGKIMQTIDSGLIVCKDDITGIVSGDEYLQVTDCSDRPNNTLCVLNDAYHTAGTCSGGNGSNTSADTGPADCLGKPVGTFCIRTNTFTTILSKVGTCTKEGTVYTCSSARQGDRCLVPSSGAEGVISPGYTEGTCVVVGSDCQTINSASIKVPGKYDAMGYCKEAAVSNTPNASSSAPSSSASNANQNAGAQAQAQEQLLPNALGVDNFYDFFLKVLAMVMKFFLYPALIGIWVWSGFLYVWAQGAPEKLKQAHNLLFWAVVTTLIVFVTNGFVLAIQGTVNSIVSP